MQRLAPNASMQVSTYGRQTPALLGEAGGGLPAVRRVLQRGVRLAPNASMQVSTYGRQTSARFSEEGGAGCSWKPLPYRPIPRPPSLTWTFWQAASSRREAAQVAKISSRRPAYGPTPSGAPMWFRTIGVSGNARASAVISGNCGWYSQASKERPSGASWAKPTRYDGSAARCGGFAVEAPSAAS